MSVEERTREDLLRGMEHDAAPPDDGAPPAIRTLAQGGRVWFDEVAADSEAWLSVDEDVVMEVGPQ